MSWGISSKIAVPAKELEAKLKEDMEAHRNAQTVPLSKEVEEQFEVALGAVKHLAESGAVGTEHLFATISGHANEGHKPAEGWSNDSLTISLRSHPKVDPSAGQ
jgi:hypothetical protein